MREAIYRAWDLTEEEAETREVYSRISVTTQFASIRSQIVRGKYSLVFCPLVAAAQDIAHAVYGAELERSVVDLNEEYRGRFFFYGTRETAEWARENGFYPEEGVVLVLEGDPTSWVGKANEALDGAVQHLVAHLRTRKERRDAEVRARKARQEQRETEASEAQTRREQNETGS